MKKSITRLTEKLKTTEIESIKKKIKETSEIYSNTSKLKFRKRKSLKLELKYLSTRLREKVVKAQKENI